MDGVWAAKKYLIAKTWEQPRHPMADECKWIKKMWHIHTLEYYSAIKRRKSCHL